MMRIVISKHLEVLIQTGEHLYRHHHSDTLYPGQVCSSFTLDVSQVVSDTVKVRTQINSSGNEHFSTFQETRESLIPGTLSDALLDFSKC